MAKKQLQIGTHQGTNVVSYELPTLEIVLSEKTILSQMPSRDPGSLAATFKDIWNQARISTQELSYLLFFDAEGKAIGSMHLGAGALTMTLADINIACAAALCCRATGVALAHNHPSGNLRPSDADKQLTKQLAEAMKMHGVQLIDSQIITGNDYVSWSEEGMLT